MTWAETKAAEMVAAGIADEERRIARRERRYEAQARGEGRRVSDVVGPAPVVEVVSESCVDDTPGAPARHVRT